MTTTTQPDLIERIARRRERLGMSFDVLAQRSGVSAPTLKRMMPTRNPRPRPRNLRKGGHRADTANGQSEAAGQGTATRVSLRNALAAAAALGMTVTAEADLPAEELCERQAEAKARELVALVQGTSALEAQGLDAETVERMIEETKHQLLNGPRQRLWGGGAVGGGVSP